MSSWLETCHDAKTSIYLHYRRHTRKTWCIPCENIPILTLNPWSPCCNLFVVVKPLATRLTNTFFFKLGLSQGSRLKIAKSGTKISWVLTSFISYFCRQLWMKHWGETPARNTAQCRWDAAGLWSRSLTACSMTSDAAEVSDDAQSHWDWCFPWNKR